MNNWSALLSLLFLINFSSALVQNFTDFEIDVSVDVPANQEWAAISLSMNSLDFDDVNTSTESDYYRIDINNSGNVNITIKPKLVESEDDIFENLYFAHRSPSTHSSYEKIGNWELNLSKTYNAGQVNKDYFYVKLYLRNYDSVVPFDIVNHQNTIIFDIIPRYD
jgi:hypothetical protein